MDEILRMLGKSEVKLMADAGDLAVLMLGVFPSVISEIMEGRVGKGIQDAD